MKNPFAETLKKAMDSLESGTLLEKALQTTDFSASNTLGVDEADMFISEVVAESMILSQCTVWRTTKASGQLSFYDLPGYILETVAENQDTSNTHKPTFRKVPFQTEKARAAIDITSEALEDNIEGPAFQAKLMSDIIKRIADNSEVLGWVGDESQAGSDTYSLLLKTNDGWIKQMTTANGCNILSGNGRRLSFAMLDRMFAKLPHKYKNPATLSQFRWVISYGSAVALVTDGSARATNLGDQFRTTGQLPPVHGIPFLIVPLFPEDQAISGTASLGSEVLLLDPKNLVYVVQRDVSSEWERKPRNDRWEGTFYLRSDYVIKDIPAIVRCDDVSVDPAVALYS